MPDEGILKALAELEAQNQPKKPGRPKGSKDKQPRKSRSVPATFPDEDRQLVDPKTGIVVSNNAQQSQIIKRMGDERVTAFVQYHVDMLKMRQGVDKKNAQDLYQRFLSYLEYCADHGVVPNNMNAYFAIGVDRGDIYAWRSGRSGTPEHKQFALDVTQFFESIHEQGAIDGMFNIVSGMFWQKAHDGLSDQPKVEIEVSNPLGEKRSAEDIAREYGELPD